MGKYTSRKSQRSFWREAGLAIALPVAVISGGIAYKHYRGRPPEFSVRGGLTDQDLEIARKYPAKRQGFLDRLYAEEPPPHCKGFVYDFSYQKFRTQANELVKILEDKRGIENPEILNTMLAGIPSSLEIMGKGVESPIFVGSRFFNRNYGPTNIEDARSVLIDHEGHHVQDIYYGYRIEGLVIDYRSTTELDRPFVSNLHEARAWHNQAKKLNDRRGASLDIAQYIRNNGSREIAGLVLKSNRDDRIGYIARAQLGAFNDVRVLNVGGNTVIKFDSLEPSDFK